MMKTSVVLSLEHSPLFTLRWLWFAQGQELSTPIILVDNGSNRDLVDLVSNASLFPALNLTYVLREGACFRDLCLAGVERANTKYALIGDTRSFLFAYGIQRGEEFLKANSGFSAVCGYISTYDQDPPQSPELEDIGGLLCLWRNVFNPLEVTDKSGSMRILQRLYHEVHVDGFVQKRTDLRHALRESVKLRIDDRDALDLFLGGFQALLGSVKFDFSYMSAAYPRRVFIDKYDPFDVSHRVMNGDWVSQLNRGAARLAALVERADWGVVRAFLFRMHRLYRAVRADDFEEPHSGAEVRVRTGMSHYLHDWLGIRFCPILLNGPDTAMLGLLDQDDPNAIAAGQEDFSKAEKTLNGDDFIAFVRTNAPALLGDSGAVNASGSE